MVREKYDAAKSAGALSFAASHVAELHVTGVPFQLRYCPSLAKKPVKSEEQARPKPRFDPFENPSSDLLIADISDGSPEHILVLNKFPIIANHFILATKTSKEQTHLLEEEDIYQTYQCLRSWSKAQPGLSSQARLYGFFNSGDHSGASQPHRHVQFLPIEDIRHKSTPSWTLLTDRILEKGTASGLPGLIRLRDLPFVNYGIRLKADADRTELHAVYKLLHRVATATVRRYIEKNTDLQFDDTVEGCSPISYNLGMTEDAMIICPRRAEGHAVLRENGSRVDIVALNGTLLAGTLMVKNENVYNVLKGTPERLSDILQAIGIPTSQGYDELSEEDLIEHTGRGNDPPFFPAL